MYVYVVVYPVPSCNYNIFQHNIHVCSVTASPVRELSIITEGATHAELQWSHYIATCPMAVEFNISVKCVDEPIICDFIPEPARFQVSICCRISSFIFFTSNC